MKTSMNTISPEELWRYDEIEIAGMFRMGYQISPKENPQAITQQVTDPVRTQVLSTMMTTHHDDRITDGDRNPCKNCFPPDPSGLPIIDLSTFDASCIGKIK